MPQDTELPEGSEFTDVVDLKALLMERKHQFAHCLTEKLLIYATGRQMGFADRPHIDGIVHDLEEKGWGLRDLVLLIIESKPFQG